MSGTSSEYRRGYEDGERDGYQSGISTIDPVSIAKDRVEIYRRGWYDALKAVRTARGSGATGPLDPSPLPPPHPKQLEPLHRRHSGSPRVTGQMVEQAWRARCFETCRDPHCKTAMDCRGPSVAELSAMRAQMESDNEA